MKVLLISTNREVRYQPIAPLGLAYLFKSLTDWGHEVEILDLAYFKDWRNEVQDRLVTFQPGIIGVSIRNIDNSSNLNYFSYLPEIREMVLYIQSISNVKIVLGGAGFSIIPEELLEYLQMDLGIVGEGEESFPKLIDCLIKGNDPAFVPNLIYKADSGDNPWRRTSYQQLKPEQIMTPDRAQIAKNFLAEGDLGNIETSRGCAFGCIYCSVPGLSGYECRLRDLYTVMDELRAMVAQGFRQIFMVDNIFNFPYPRAAELCDLILRQDISFNWSCQVHPKHLDADLCGLMKRSGCQSIQIGALSGADSILEDSGKGFTSDELCSAVQLARTYGMEVGLLFIIGMPGEDSKTVAATVKLLEEFIDIGVSCIVEFGVRVFKNTKLYTRLTAQGYKLNPTFPPCFYIEPYVLENLDLIKPRLPEKALEHKKSRFYEILTQDLTDVTERRNYINRLGQLKKEKTG